MFVVGNDVERLSQAADPDCPNCKGEGFWRYPYRWGSGVEVSCKCTDDDFCASIQTAIKPLPKESR